MHPTRTTRSRLARTVVPSLLQDNSRVLEMLLHLFYSDVTAASPGTRLTFESMEEALQVHTIVKKYCMHPCVFNAFQQAVLPSKMVASQNPIAQYCLGIRIQSEVFIRDAARKGLDFSRETFIQDPSLTSQLDFVKARDIVMLLRYHEDCGSKAAEKLKLKTTESDWLGKALANNHPWTMRTLYPAQIHARFRTLLPEVYMHDWVHDYLAALDPLLRTRPSPKTIKPGSLDLLDALAFKYKYCSRCEKTKASSAATFVDMLCEDVESAVNEVCTCS